MPAPWASEPPEPEVQSFYSQAVKLSVGKRWVAKVLIETRAQVLEPVSLALERAGIGRIFVDDANAGVLSVVELVRGLLGESASGRRKECRICSELLLEWLLGRGGELVLLSSEILQ